MSTRYADDIVLMEPIHRKVLMEPIQRKAVRIIFSFTNDMPYTNALCRHLQFD